MISRRHAVARRRAIQHTLRREERQELNRRDGCAVGSTDWRKEEGTLRLAFQNINGFGLSKEKIKDKQLFDFLKEEEVDMMGMAEANICWPKADQKNRLWDRTRGWFECSNVNYAHNTLEPRISTLSQPGGVASIIVDKLAHKVDASGKDFTGLGRWTWTKFKGKNNMHLRVITVYRPCKTEGSKTAYTQQLRYLTKIQDERNPRDVLMDDLRTEIKKWSLEGDSIIIMGDWNEDVRSQGMTEWKEELNLRDAMFDMVGRENAPRTYHRGSKPIDTILCSANVRLRKAGYLPFGEGAGDHRPLLLDIDEISVLGSKGTPSAKVKARRLKLNDPRIIAKYTSTLHKFYLKHNLYWKVSQLNAIPITYPVEKRVSEAYESIDELRVQGMTHAEKKCRKFHAGKIPWSPEVSKAQLNIELWTLVSRRLRKCRVHARTILRKKKQAGYTGCTNVDLQEACTNLQSSYNEYRNILKDCKERRVTFINDLAIAKAKAGKIKAANALKAMELTEQQRASWARIHRMDGTARTGVGLTKVIAPDDEGNWNELDTRLDIERAALKEIQRGSTQTKGTTLTEEPMLNELGHLGIGPAADAILDGTYVPPHEVADDVGDILKSLKCPPTIRMQRQPSPITCEEHSSGWKKVRERTSSSPSGLHVGHWKCGSMDSNINWVNTSLANIPFLSGYSPKRWRHGINVLLEKSKGNCRIDKLRKILLYEADFNMNNKYLGRDMMKCAEKGKMLAKEQYGSRKRKTAILHALNKRLTFDILRQQKKGAGICSCDLKSCYDRIVHSFATLAMRRAGAAESSTSSMFKTIQRLQHRVRTAFGDSAATFGGDEWSDLEALMGVGQGNGAGPAIWAVISTVFFDVLRKHGYGALLQAPFSRRKLDIAGFGFVDDTDLVQTGLSTDDYWDIATKLQSAVELWEKCTEMSGGCLVPAKSWWTLVDFTWHNGKWDYNSDMNDVSIEIKDSNGQQKVLEQLAANEAQKMLGVWLAPDGNNKKQVEEMRKQTVEWAEKVRTGAIDRRDAWQALNSTILKKLEYPLVALTLSKAQCDYVMAPALERGLPRAGICRNMPRAVIYGDLDHQGMGLHNLYTTMGLHQVQALLTNIWRDNITGKLLRISLESFKLELGISGSIFNKNYYSYKHIATDCWVKHLWKFVQDECIDIYDEVEGGGLLREKDSMLSSNFANAERMEVITKGEWSSANRCRLFLQVLTVADISTGDGTAIDKNYLQGMQQTGRSRVADWPTQGQPSAQDWTAWRRVLRLVLGSGNQYTLTTKLGAWLEPYASKALPNWPWFWDKHNDIIYNNMHTYWEAYAGRTRRQTRQGSSVYVPSTRLQAIPDNIVLTRTSVHVITGHITMTGGVGQHPDRLPMTLEEVVEHNTNADLLKTKIKALQGDRWSAREVMMTQSIDGILDSLRDGTAVGVSDGSYKDNFGTACWILENNTGTERIVGLIDVPGHDDEHDAYRSEIAGLYGIVMAVNMLMKIGNISGAKIEVGCDGLSALHRSFWANEADISCTNAHFDLLSGIHGLKRDMDVTWTYRHIPGHQDNIPLANLDRWAILNIECDYRAKLFMTTIVKGYRRATHTIRGGMWQVSIQGKLVGTKLSRYLRKTIQGGIIFEYWVDKRKRISEQAIDMIDWDTQGKAMRLCSIHQRHWVSKFVSGWCATGKTMRRRGERVTASCPRCNHKNEDATHILTCRATSAVLEWDESTVRMKEWLDSHNSCPDLSKLIVATMQGWKAKAPIEYTPEYDFDGMERLINCQSKIGWRSFWDGCLSHEWGAIQQTYLTWTKSKQTGKRWVAGLIRQLWEVEKAAWLHRNSVLHDTPLADIMCGTLSLDRSLRTEWSLGFIGLPPLIQVVLPKEIGQVIEGTVAERKGWLVLIRTARENMGDTRISDEFSDKKSTLRRWVGL